MKKLILALAVILVGFASCYKDNAEDMYPSAGNSGGTCDTANVTFNAIVKPIIDANCAISGCHIMPTSSGIDLTSYHGVSAIAGSGKLISAITHDGRASFMPKNQPKLDDCTIAKITKWVNAGAPDN